MLWGGDKIIPYKGIVSDAKSVGESWEISGVKENESVVAEGPDAGMLLPELIKRDGAALLGKANLERFGEEFPLLIKFIDARQDLSIQVHPNDEQAWERHRSKGKTEMWYVVDADPGSSLRSGFAKQVTPEEYEASIADNTITDLLAEYDIKAGDLFFLPAGRIHSIGAGAFIAEIQQTSNITYRIYDFNRVDANGNPRELHTEQSKAALMSVGLCTVLLKLWTTVLTRHLLDIVLKFLYQSTKMAVARCQTTVVAFQRALLQAKAKALLKWC